MNSSSRSNIWNRIFANIFKIASTRRLPITTGNGKSEYYRVERNTYMRIVSSISYTPAFYIARIYGEPNEKRRQSRVSLLCVTSGNRFRGISSQPQFSFSRFRRLFRETKEDEGRYELNVGAARFGVKNNKKNSKFKKIGSEKWPHFEKKIANSFENISSFFF